MVKPRPTVTLRSRDAMLLLGAIATFLVLADLIGLLMKYGFGHNSVYGLVPLFDLDCERNAPTFFSTCLFLINAVLFLGLWKATHVRSEPAKIWMFLAGLFCFLAADEFCCLHERFVQPLRSALHASGLFYFPWVIPYGIAVLLLSIFVLPALRRIERGIRFWFVLSAATYLSGALGFEMIGGKYLDMTGNREDIIYEFFVVFEESLEMAGLILLVYALLSLIRSYYAEFLFLIPPTRDASENRDVLA